MNAVTDKLTDSQWHTLCHVRDLVPDSGIAALLPESGQQVALFWLKSENALFAMDNYDPLSDTYLNARGLIGDMQGDPVLATPLYKHHYRLTDGQCLEDSEVQLKIWPVKINNEEVCILI